MQDNLQVIKDVITIATPLINVIIKSWIEPKIEKLKLDYKQDKKLTVPIGNAFYEYLNRVCKEKYFINTIVFQDRNIKLEDLYIPLNIRSFHLIIYESAIVPFLLNKYWQCSR
jgi:hypothetical protein